MVPKRKDEIPVLWDDLDFDEDSTRLVLAEKFSGVFRGAPRAEELSVADFETVRIPRPEPSPGRAFERFFAEEFLETVLKPRPNVQPRRAVTKVMPRRALPTPLRAVPSPPRPVAPVRASPEVLVPRPIVAPTWGRPADPLAPTALAVVPPTRSRSETRTKPRPRRSLIPWAALLMGFVVGVGLFSDATRSGHVQRLIEVVASFVDPAINGR